ncbi:MAG: hypothetical protein V1725_01705 [archaeon]
MNEKKREEQRKKAEEELREQQAAETLENVRCELRQKASTYAFPLSASDYCTSKSTTLSEYSIQLVEAMEGKEPEGCMSALERLVRRGECCGAEAITDLRFDLKQGGYCEWRFNHAYGTALIPKNRPTSQE